MDLEKLRYLSLCGAPAPSKHKQGIVVASDLSQEWLLPWWWNHYRKHNDFPVTFVDLGLSPSMKQWCQEKGDYVHLPLAACFVAGKEDVFPLDAQEWEKSYGVRFWDSRRAWFRKPLACLHSPYPSSLWIDLDCEVKHSLQPLFSFCKHPSGLSVAKEAWGEEEGINSGVLAFQRGAALIQAWAIECLEKHLVCKGDQDVLHALLKERKLSVGELPPIYNWSRLKGDYAQAVIVHWHGHYGKEIIAHKIRQEELSSFLS